MDNKEIGIATMRYKDTGEVISAIFKPTMLSETKVDFLRNLKGNLTKDDNVEEIANNAEIALASFFSQINSIELADREKQQIVSTPFKCVFYSSGNIKKCVVKFILKTIDNEIIKLHEQNSN